MGEEIHAKTEKCSFFTKEIVRITAGIKPIIHAGISLQIRDPTSSMYTLDRFQMNSAVHSPNTRKIYHLPTPSTRLSCLQRSSHYTGINIFQLSSTFKRHTHSFFMSDTLLMFKISYNYWKEFVLYSKPLQGMVYIINACTVSFQCCTITSPTPTKQTV